MRDRDMIKGRPRRHALCILLTHSSELKIRKPSTSGVPWFPCKTTPKGYRRKEKQKTKDTPKSRLLVRTAHLSVKNPNIHTTQGGMDCPRDANSTAPLSTASMLDTSLAVLPSFSSRKPSAGLFINGSFSTEPKGQLRRCQASKEFKGPAP